MTARQETLDFTQTAAGQSLGAMPCSALVLDAGYSVAGLVGYSEAGICENKEAH